MKVAPFIYHAPRTIGEATDLLHTLRNARPLAGGQSLVPYLAFRMQRHDHLIDLNRVDSLSGITSGTDHIEIGAMTRQRELAGSLLIAEGCPIAQDALHLIGHIATRSRGTLGGSLCNMDPSAELWCVSLLHDASLQIEGASGGRVVAVADWVRGFMQPAIEPNELLTHISWTPWPRLHGHAFVEFSKRHHDYAVVAAGALITVDADRRITRAAIAVAGCALKPMRLVVGEAALLGEVASPALFEEAVREIETLPLFTATEADQGYPRRFVSGEYRRRLGLVLSRRAIAAAYDDAIQKHEAFAHG
jgi:aerobic carbon-monoxide dehydrogenase medium subunit